MAWQQSGGNGVAASEIISKQNAANRRRHSEKSIGIAASKYQSKKRRSVATLAYDGNQQRRKAAAEIGGEISWRQRRP